MRVKVAIIGGGFAGAATAYFLSRAGVQGIVLLEREAVCGAHASGRNAALCRSVTEDPHWTALTTRGAAVLRAPPPDLAPAPLVTPTGALLVASRPGTLADIAAQAVAFAVPHQALDRAALEARWPLLAGMPAEGAVSFPDDGVIDVHGLLQGYLAAARAAGVQVVTGTEVLGLRSTDAGMELTTTGQTLQAECVVNAAGAWVGALGALAGADAPPFATLRRHLFVSARDPRVDARAPWLWHLDEGFYLRPESGAWLLSACDEDAHPASAPEVSPDAIEYLAERAAALAPGLHSLAIARSWACLRTFTPDRRPLIGWDRAVPSLFWVAGLGGHGATASAAVGALAAEAIRERLAPAARS